MLTIRITKDDVSPHLQRILQTIQPGGALQKDLGRGAANALRRHFRDLNDARQNQLGGPRSNFYSRVAESVHSPIDIGATIRIAISHPHIAQRLRGGPIRPRKKKAIGIPAHASAYGVMPRIYPGTLAFIPLRRGDTIGVLVEGEERAITRGERKGAKRKAPKPDGKLIYVLRTQVRQKADPTVLPGAATIEAALTRAAQVYLATLRP